MTAQFELCANDTASQPAIELHGEVDTTNAADFERDLGARISQGRVVLDLSRVAYFDSAGFEVLDRLLATGAVVVVISTTSVVRRAASVIGIPYHDTLDQAIQALTTTR